MKPLPIGVAGIGEGGLLALYATALDRRIDACLVCGYFNQRENLWAEPIYRNVWSLLTEFGDADLASLVAPRTLTLEASASLEIDGPRGHEKSPSPRQVPSIHCSSNFFETKWHWLKNILNNSNSQTISTGLKAKMARARLQLQKRSTHSAKP